MDEPWMKPGEYVLLESRAWVWVKVIAGPGFTKAKIYLTNHRLYGKDALFRIKLFNFPFHTIKKIKRKKKYLHIEAEIKGRRQALDIRIKDIDESWEWMIWERIKMLKR